MREVSPGLDASRPKSAELGGQYSTSNPDRGPTLIALVAFIVFIDMLGMGLIVPVMPQLIMDISHVGLDQAAEIGGYLLFAYALMQFGCAPIIGALSDQFGRRPILLTTLLALGLNYMIMAMANSLAIIVLGRLISGIMGASWSAANACVADCIDKEKRGAAFGALGGAGAVGFVLGPALGGIAGEFGPRLPFVIAGFLALMGAALGAIALRETLAPHKRRPFSMAHANPFGALQHVSRNRLVGGCLLVVFLLQLSAQAHLSIWAFYGAEKFGWTPMTAGLTVTVYGISIGGVQALLTGRSITAFGAAKTAKFSLLFGIPSYILIAFAPNTPTILFAVAIGCIIGMTFPALQSIMTAAMQEDSQGELQGAIASTIGLTAIIGPILMTHVFSAFSDQSGPYFPGAPFILAAAILLLAIATLWTILARSDAEGRLGN